jgi:hypothetical protein
MTEIDVLQYATTQGVSFVFAIVVLYMIRDMITKMNENYCKLTDAIIKIAEKEKLNGQKT